MRTFLFFFLISISSLFYESYGQLPDSARLKTDSIIATDSSNQKKDIGSLEKIISRNSLLNNQSVAESYVSKTRKYVSSNSIFYVVLGMIFFLAIIKTLFDKYFSNLLRVFFQTSLRQSQLTDQLMQAGLPSLLMNIFFVLSGALYITLLTSRHTGNLNVDWRLFGFSAIALTLIYLVKYLSLQFTGWISGYSKEAESYSFIVFLINKIIAISLLPLLIFMAFADNEIAEVAIYLSYLFIAVIFLSRFLRSMSLLQHRFRVNRIHFFFYIVGVELLPILLICKATVIIFSKNL